MKNLKNVTPTHQNSKKKLHTIATYLFLQFTLFFLYSFPCFADTENNYTETGAKWLLDQLFWVAIVVVIIIFIKNLMARNTVASVISLLVGGIVCFFIKSPETIGTLGETIGNIIFK